VPGIITPRPATVLHRYLVCAGVLTLTLLSGDFALAGFREHNRSDRNPARPLHACTCVDGRQFVLGASVFGKNSSRVVITGFSPDLPATAVAGIPSRCTDLVVVGQVVRRAAAEDARPFLRRETRKQGTLVNVCETKIRFVEPKKSYDFFANDGSALTLSDEDKVAPHTSGDTGDETGSSDETASDTVLNEDLTGRDLLRLIPAVEATGDPSSSPFNEDDLKEGAYFIVRKRVKAQTASDDEQNVAIAHVQSGDQVEVNVPAGTLGQIEKASGFRSEPIWIAEIYPDSVPMPFWRSLLSGPKGFERRAVPPQKVVLRSSEIVEINHFLDQYGIEWTRFGEDGDAEREHRDNGTTQLPEIYSPPELPLDENISIAKQARMLDAIRAAAIRLVFDWKPQQQPEPSGVLVIEEQNVRSTGEAIPDLLHRQCFIDPGMFAFAGSGAHGESRGALVVNDVDVRIFRPQDSAQESPDYYAIDLDLNLTRESGGSGGTIVCRFPSAPIDLGLLGMAEQILSSRFDIATRN